MLAKGTMLAGYRLDGVLGKGGMGVVYEATQLSLNRTVALKVLAPHLSDDEAFRERFRREGLIQAAIDHPNIVTVYEAGETEHGLFIAMRLVRGPTLKDMILARELDAGRSLRILRPVADALDTAHEAGLIHRDVKPQNVLVAGRDHAYLADFGLTKAIGDTGLTRTGQFVGTLDYISPEQIRGEQATGQSDVYALAAVLYECLTGVVPYARDSDVAVLYAHMTDPAPKVSEQRPDLPGLLDGVIEQGMAKDPADRFASAGALLDAAERAFDEHVHAAITPPGPIEVPEEAGIRETAVDPGETVWSADAATEAETESGAPAPTAAAATAPEAGDLTVKADMSPTVDAAIAPTVDAPVATVDEAPRAAPPAAPPARAGGFPLRAVAIAAAVVAVAVVGVLIGGSGSGKGSAAGTDQAAAGALKVSYPQGWARSASPVEIPGLPITSQIAVAPARPADGEALVAGTVAAGGRLLLPGDFVSKLPGGAPRGETVKLGDLQAYRYSALAPQGLAQQVTLYTVPMDGGVATVACLYGARTPSSFRAACDRAAGSLELSGKHYPVGPSVRYSSALGATMVSLNTAVDAGRTALGAAATPAAQASAAAGLGAAFGRAAGRLAKLKLSPADAAANGAILNALRATARDYSAAAAAAGRGDRAAYNRAGADIRRDRQDTQNALAALKQLGYPVQAG